MNAKSALNCERFTAGAAVGQKSQKDQGNSKTVFSCDLLVVDVQNLPLVQAYPTCKRDCGPGKCQSVGLKFCPKRN